MTDFLTELQEVRKRPYPYICDWLESSLMHVGKRAMSVLSLQPCSLILPDINFNSTHIRSSFNILFLAPPSSGKSTLCRKYGEVCLSPLNVRGITTRALEENLERMKLFTLISEDFVQLCSDYDTVKVIEGALGDERSIMRETMRDKISISTQGVGLLCGTWSDLGRMIEQLKGGLLFRFVLCFIDLDERQREDIGKFISNGIGNAIKTAELDVKQQAIRAYYEELKSIMAGEHEDIKQITSYCFEEDLKKKIYDEWNKMRKAISGKMEFEFTRELHEGYRFAISSALLNVFNRKCENGILYPNKEDFDLAIGLMKENLRNKVAILRSQEFVNSNTLMKVKEALGSDIDPKTKKILLNLAKHKYSSV